MYSRGKFHVSCTVCGAQFEANGKAELTTRGWNVSNGAVVCKHHSDLKWPTRRRVVSKSARARLEALR